MQGAATFEELNSFNVLAAAFVIRNSEPEQEEFSVYTLDRLLEYR